MATQAKKSLRGSADDILDDLLGSEEPPQAPLHTTAAVQGRKELTFDDDDDDDLLEALGFDSGKKEEELRPARSQLDELFGRGSAAKVLEEPEDFTLDEKSQKKAGKEEGWDKEDLVFGEYQPSMGSRPSRRQLVRFTAETRGDLKTESSSKPSPPASQNPVRRRGSGADWLGLKDEVIFDSEPQSPVKTSTVGISPSPASQLPATEEAVAKTSPQEEEEDWLTAALARKKSRAQAKAKEREAEPLEAAGKGPRPRSPLSQPAASPAAARPAAAPQDTAASSGGSREPVPWLSTVKPASVKPSETAKENSNRDANAMVPTPSLPGEKEIPGPAPLPQAEAPALDVLPEKRLGTPVAQLCEDSSGYGAELLSTQLRVVKLEDRVQTLEMLLEGQKLFLQTVQQQHQEHLEILKSNHRSLMEAQAEMHRQQEDTLRWEKEQLLAQMEQQRQDAEQERVWLLEQHRSALQNLREMQRETIQNLRKDYEEQIQHLKWLKEQEMDVVTSALSCTRTGRHALECKVEAAHHSASQELPTKAQQWDERLRMPQDRLSQHQKDVEEERSRLRELTAKTEARLDEQTRLLEQEWAELRIHREELRAKEEQLGKDRERLDEAWKELRMEKEEVNAAALRVKLQEEEMEKLWAQKIAGAHRVESEHQPRLQDMLHNLEQLKQQQQQQQSLHQGSVPSAQDLGAAVCNGLSSTMAAAPWAPIPDVPPSIETPPRHRFRDIGEITDMANRALFNAHAEALRFQIKKEKYLLEKEVLFTQSEKKALCKTSSTRASRPSFSGL